MSKQAVVESPLSQFIIQTDEARAVVKPDEVGTFWIEQEYDHAETSQRELHAEIGEREALQSDVMAARHAVQAEIDREVANAARKAAHDASAKLTTLKRVLDPHAHRAHDAKYIKYIGMGLLFGGDVAGVTGAAILIGEEPLIALGQAVGVGASVIIAGLTGKDVRHGVDARDRRKDPSDLTAEERPYAHLFGGRGLTGMLLVVLGAITVVAMMCIGIGIFTIRSEAEGMNAAIAFAAFGASMAVASFILNFATADEVADIISYSERSSKRADRKANRAGRTTAIVEHAAAVAQAKVYRLASKHAAEAAAAEIRSQKYRALAANPGVAGHGAKPSSDSIVNRLQKDLFSNLDASTLKVEAVATNGRLPDADFVEWLEEQ